MARVSRQPRAEEENSQRLAENAAVTRGISIPKNGVGRKENCIVEWYRIKIEKTAAFKREFKKCVLGRREK